MKYPAILKNTIGGQTVLAVSGKLFIHMSGEFEVEDSESYSFDSRYKNITAEYLANTYGEVKSKEHAEFIVKLTEVNGFEIGQVDDNPKSFMIYDNVICTHRLSHNQLSNNFNRKQITIPLPPECESVDEWPKVGDEVEFPSGKGVLTLSPDTSGVVIVKSTDEESLGEYKKVAYSALQKPKTQEQELLDELSDLAFSQFNDDSYDLTHNSYYLAEKLISKYNITKKGEGDE